MGIRELLVSVVSHPPQGIGRWRIRESMAPRSLTGSRGQGIYAAMYQLQVTTCSRTDPVSGLRESITALEKIEKKMSLTVPIKKCGSVRFVFAEMGN